MTAKNKRRGNIFEKEIVKLAQEYGLDAQRAWGSDGRALGLHPEVDVVVEHLKIQCKRRKTMPSWLAPNNNVHIQAVRKDRDRPYIVIPADLFFLIVSELNKWRPVTYPWQDKNG